MARPTVVRAETDTELLELTTVRRAIDPDAHPSLEGLRHTLETFPHAVYLLARQVAEDDPDSLAWVERRGFVEVERQKSLELDLASVPVSTGSPPAGVSIVPRSAEHEGAMYRVGLEAGKDIPGLDSEHDPTFEEWRSFEIERPSRRPELAFVALAEGEVIGFASVDVFGDSDTGWHGLTAVTRAWRGRGVGAALKRAQIDAARRLGLRRLLTESEERNAPGATAQREARLPAGTRDDRPTRPGPGPCG